jgi:hypothetical protein
MPADRTAQPMSRRAVLLGGGVAAAWLALGGDRLEAASAPPATQKASPRTPQTTVAIVGAGLAGLSAALTLHDADVTATVYEAADQAGGRVHSNTTGYWRDGQVSEWCGELINTDHQTVLRLARRFGLSYAKAGFDPLKRRAIEELGMGRNSKLHLQLASRSWRRPDAARPGSGVVAIDRGPLVTWESSRAQSGGSGLLVCYGLDEASGALAAPLPWGDASAHSHVAEMARSTLLVQTDRRSDVSGRRRGRGSIGSSAGTVVGKRFAQASRPSAGRVA